MTDELTRVTDLPDTAIARAALEVAQAYCSPALLNHSIRSFLWGRVYAERLGHAFDAELYFVASMLHDIGLTREFDNHALPFEEAGGHVARVFAAGAGWDAARGHRAGDIIVRHMWDQVDPALDVEGHLLERATSFDISGSGADHYPDDARTLVLARYPRLDLAAEFAASFEDQARRKPGCAAAAISSGLEARLAANPLERSG